MEHFKVLAKTGRIALLQIRFDSENELKSFCDKLPQVTHGDLHHGHESVGAEDGVESECPAHQGGAFAACLISPEFQDAI